LQREFNIAEKEFRLQVTAFFADLEIAAGTAEPLTAWKDAVIEQGWSVPAWPRDAGGPGWSAAQVFIWQQACAAHGIDVEADPGVWIVGPLLFDEATESQRQRFLPAIRELRARWCIGFAEPDADTELAHLATTAQLANGQYVIAGTKTWVVDGTAADWMCALVRLGPGADDFALFAVAMDSPGLQTKSIKTLDGGLTMAEVSLADVSVPLENLLAGPANGQSLAQLICVSDYAVLSRSALARAQLDALEVSLAALDPEDGVHIKHSEIAVALSGLEALELRFLDARSRGEEPPFPLAMLRMKSREILLQLGALQMECFGYYALPYPDESLLHNEGPIGPGDAVATVRRTLVQQVAVIYEGNAALLKDEMARHLGY